MLRWLERVQGVPVSELRVALALRIDAATDKLPEHWPDCSAAQIDGVTFLISGGVVTTVMRGKRANRVRGQDD